MNIDNLTADDAILTELGQRIAATRLDHQLTQAALAEQAGVAKRTVERIEAGASAQLASLIRVLRVLELLPNLDQVIPAPGPSPIDLLQRRGKARRRASSARAEQAADEPWSWGDDA